MWRTLQAYPESQKYMSAALGAEIVRIGGQAMIQTSVKALMSSFGYISRERK